MPVTQARIRSLNDREIVAGDYVLYWMQQSQRAEHNPALDVAIGEANRLKRPVLVTFGLTDAYPEANLRHYRFMLEGLQDAQTELRRKGIQLVVRRGQPAEVALDLGRRATLIVCDVGYTRHQRQWRRTVATRAKCRVLAVEGDVVVPVTVASAKAEYAARTLRPRIKKHLDGYLKLARAVKSHHASLHFKIDGIDLGDIDQVLESLTIRRTVPAVSKLFKGGCREAKKRLRVFIRDHLSRYNDHGNQPQTGGISHMSPYLHFGQISPVYVALQVHRARQGRRIDRAAYLEQLIVRRELAANFVHYTPDYDRYTCLPEWARKSLADHAGDRRPVMYTRKQLEAARTHDPYWNAAMGEMKHTGFMHNHMRMYWGKKILEWSASPEKAFETILSINNKYFLDGRDPNSYAGVAWIFGKHDRAWPERPIFGKVRTMTAGGLERKCDIRAYVRKVENQIVSIHVIDITDCI
jgi:deoxyribodipyrimidine photo-lyase